MSDLASYVPMTWIVDADGDAGGTWDEADDPVALGSAGGDWATIAVGVVTGAEIVGEAAANEDPPGAADATVPEDGEPEAGTDAHPAALAPIAITIANERQQRLGCGDPFIATRLVTTPQTVQSFTDRVERLRGAARASRRPA